MNGTNHDASHAEDLRRSAVWNRLRWALHADETVEGVILRCVRRGYIVDFGGVTGFLPGSQLNTLPIVDIAPFLNHEWSFKVLKCDPEHGRLIVSRRATLPPIEVENVDLQKKYFVGQRLTGVVTQNLPFGTFVDLGGIAGFLPNEPDNPEMAPGAIISVVVRRLDCAVQRIVLQLD